VGRLGGSISAEHGLGLAKNEAVARYKGAEEIAVMRALKQALDPNNILNPGKVLPP
jgi:FAD/FMN-containing dehydrogenase